MTESLPAYLKRRAARSLEYLLREAEAVSAEEARRGRRSDWPAQPWGIGQDGSIAGIVCHVAAWKQITLPLLDGTHPPAAHDDLPHFNSDDWPAVLAWLRSIGETWLSALEALPDTEFDSPRDWEGGQITVARLATELVQHDVQHAAQIEYLRQLYSVEEKA
ncbi:MAG TPA: DinB family protein [Chthonomonadaceae bacterium]|nr:DinB family protein [Chthonomonadaceae bacterium]